METELAELEELMTAFDSDERIRALEDKTMSMEDEYDPTAVLDSGATSGVAAQKDRKALEETGQTSDKIFLLLTSQEARATKVLKMKHKLREPATEMHRVKDLHTTLVSVPKLADADYITVLDK